jgi:nucleoside-diphosphate-sugar epimerase
MRILITGAAGFVGSHLAERLVRAGHAVVGLDNLVTGSRENVAGLDALGDFRLVEADIIEELPVDGRFEHIYHLASPASPIDYVELPFETLFVGSKGTERCLDLAVGLRGFQGDPVDLTFFHGAEQERYHQEDEADEQADGAEAARGHEPHPVPAEPGFFWCIHNYLPKRLA